VCMCVVKEKVWCTWAKPAHLPSSTAWENTDGMSSSRLNLHLLRIPQFN
jgi:hypothetical protein